MQSAQLTKVLVEEDFRTQFPVTELFGLVSKLPEMFRDIRMAHVDRQTDHYARNQFGATVARDRGGHCCTFRSFDEAEAWLLSA
ncbi:MAG: hypothetical protein NTW87_06560 [Planctomycetota bacterium]|nr:hypothetical protein [Planctomycetota bacterium]